MKSSTIALLLLSSVCTFSIAASTASPPNVIVVMTDDQGYGEFSCHGNPITETPHIDQLASQSIRLTDFHVSPMCTPTRGELMSGLDAFRNAAINVSSGRTLLRSDLITMADVFKSAGYRTGIFGKWHLGDNFPFRPGDRGFDEALWFPSSHINSVPDYWENDYFDDTYIHNGKRQKYNGYCTDVFFEEAIKWIGTPETNEQPFFAYIALNAAHSPWFVPDKFRGPIRDAIAKNPEVVAGLNEQKLANLVSFLAMGANIDENVGVLDSHLQDANLFDNTIVVFLTDNGSTMGKDYFNAGMRGMKTQLWEGGHRVPCFIRWPQGDLGSPREIDQPSRVTDLLPTLTDLAGAADRLPAKLDGQSLAPLLRNEQERLDDRMLVINYSRMPGFRVTYTKGNPAVPQRDGAVVMWKHWRLIENRELYNITKDPHQDKNIAAAHPKVVARMQRHLQDWWDGVKDDVMEPQRVVIGNDAENPMTLTACEWLDVFVDQQKQVRRGDKKNGVWHLIVDQPGEYEIELRRWPRESKIGISEGVELTQATDGVFAAGPAMPISKARLRIGEQEIETTMIDEGQSFKFVLTLPAGPTEMQTWFYSKDGQELAGAYYAYVVRR
tara:strand:- start:187974 stop:189803 length:1830 start_codon:yes stop_codon:yes gene_type:complete